MRFLLGSLGLFGVACTNVKAEPVTQEVVRAKLIELVDDNGQVRAQLKTEENGEVVLRMRGENGTIRVKLGASEAGSGLLLNNDATEPGFHALAKDTGTSLKLRNKDGTEQVITP